MIPDPKTDELGMKYYESPPEGFRKATQADLKGGYFKHNAPYLVQSFHSGHYYPRRVKFVFNQTDIPWLYAGRMWIWKP